VIDTTGSKVYMAKGTLTASDWVMLA
jgi:hypothetical protein